MRKLIAVLSTAVMITGFASPGTALAVPVPPPPGPDVISAILPSHPLTKSTQPVALTRALRQLDVTYEYGGQRYTLNDFINHRSRAWGLAVIDGIGNKLVTEHYFASTRETRFQSWSASKSFIGTAVGIAVGEGKIASIDDPVTKYVPELNDSGFANVSVRNLLRMSSGIEWSEPADISQTHLSAAAGVALTDLAKGRKRGWEPGSQHVYSGMNTFVLGWVVSKATGTPLNTYIQQKIWQPFGMTVDATLSRDHQGNSLGYCCFQASVEDYSRLGLVYLNKGKANGRQVVPEAWVEQATKPSAPFNEPSGELGVGHGFHWWLGGGGHGDYWADGFGGQKIYVSPKHNVVIAKTALFSTTSAEEELIAFRAIAAQVAATRGN